MQAGCMATMLRAVSIRVSPFWVLEPEEAKFRIPAPSFREASSKEAPYRLPSIDLRREQSSAFLVRFESSTHKKDILTGHFINQPWLIAWKRC